jgi:hypothetical protein
MAKALLAALILIKTAFGTSFYERPFAESLKSAPIMVRGKIGASQVDLATVSDGTQLVFTFYDFKVTEVIKGDLKLSTIKIREIGGEKNGVAMSVSGSAQFSAGEEVVVLLDAPVQEAYPVRGMMMGRFAIEKNQDGKEYLRGPGLGSHATQAEWSLDAVKELVQKQKTEPQTAAIPNPSGTADTRPNSISGIPANVKGAKLPSGTEGSEKSETDVTRATGEEEMVSNEAGGTRLKTRRVPSIWVVAAGLITGIYFYLRTKRKREGK